MTAFEQLESQIDQLKQDVVVAINTAISADNACLTRHLTSVLYQLTLTEESFNIRSTDEKSYAHTVAYYDNRIHG